jgi:hypothetical protein
MVCFSYGREVQMFPPCSMPSFSLIYSLSWRKCSAGLPPTGRETLWPGGLGCRPAPAQGDPGAFACARDRGPSRAQTCPRGRGRWTPEPLEGGILSGVRQGPGPARALGAPASRGAGRPAHAEARGELAVAAPPRPVETPPGWDWPHAEPLGRPLRRPPQLRQAQEPEGEGRVAGGAKPPAGGGRHPGAAGAACAWQQGPLACGIGGSLAVASGVGLFWPQGQLCRGIRRLPAQRPFPCPGARA